MLDARREHDDDRTQSMQLRLIEALARRASQHQGEARRVLDARLSELLDAQDIRDDAHNALQTPARSPLASLLDDMNQRARTQADPAELLDALRSVWSTVSAEKRLRESQAQVPKNAGPLNSNSLVHRSLSLMREISPEYLQQFLGYIDALSWMEELTLASGAAAKDAPRTTAKKNARGKAR
ncbi:hypothetical protein AWB71_02170 [Caballeronia peredens]|nr:hypothetical protein AWB71_02170 [Caballeronia peredens]